MGGLQAISFEPVPIVAPAVGVSKPISLTNGPEITYLSADEGMS